MLHGAAGEHELLCDRGIGKTFCEETKNLGLAWGQPGWVSSGGGEGAARRGPAVRTG